MAAPPLFVTDVTYYNSQAVGYLLRGVDPYGAAYTVPASLATAGASNVFAYLPGVFAFIAPAGAVWDVRLGLVVCDLVVAASLLRLGSGPNGLVSLTYLLLPPTILFSTWFVNDSLPAIAFLSVAVFFEARGRARAAAPLWGIAAASSQEMWLVFPLYAYCSLRKRRYTEVLVALGAAAAAVVPFLLWNPSAFVYDSVTFQFVRQALPFFSQGPFGLNVNPSLQGILFSLGTSAPLVARGALVAVALLLSLRWAGRSLPSLMLASTAFTVAALFLLAGEFFWAYLELPLVTLLAWTVLRRGDRSGGQDAFNT